MTVSLTPEQIAALGQTPPAASSGKAQTVVEPGYTTTEFWLTLLSYVGALFASIAHKSLPIDAPQFAMGAAGLASVGYAISRAIVKKS